MFTTTDERGLIDFQVVNYLIFREKVPEFSPLSPQWLALFEGKKVQKSYPTRFLDLFSFNHCCLKKHRISHYEIQ
ncbi:MAG: hypothetical protein LW716_18910 [Microcystis sp. 53602_E8]|nr:hypothetical protein [Microcystis sp. 53602_E8]